MEKANRADLPGPQVSTRLSLSQGSITFNENIEVQNPRFQSPVLSGKSFLPNGFFIQGYLICIYCSPRFKC